MAPRKPKAPSPEDPLAALLAGINHDLGAGTIMRLGDHALEPVEVTSTGCIALDEALGVGGLPRGRVVELYGPESGGKTTIALHSIAQAQKTGLQAAFIDAEHALDTDWAATLGVDTAALVVSQPDTGEQGLEVAEKLATSGQFGIIVIDSVSALVPRAEIEGAMGDAHVGLQARLMSQALRKLTPVVANSKTTCLFINQLREKVGVFFGNPETTSGGKALKFYASVRLDVRRIQTLKDGQLPVGIRIRVKVVKNKLAPPFRQAEVDLMFGEGLSLVGELIDLGILRQVVTKTGAYYAYKEQQLGQGKEKARLFLRQNPELAQEIELAVRLAGLLDKFEVQPAGQPVPEALIPDDGKPWDDSSPD